MDQPSPDAGDPTPATPDAAPAVPPSGAELFAEVCSPCHGAMGEGSMMGPEIRHPARPYASWVIRHGREGKGFPGPMIPYSTAVVSDQQLADILDLLWSYPKPTDAKGLYIDFCANCHGANGRGGTVGTSIVGKSTTEITSTVRSGKGVSTDYGNRTKYMPPFSKTQITDAELALLAPYARAPK
jgi:mono/diheme cytochrome c family protein